MKILEFLILALAAWNITSLLVTEEGPFNIFGRIRGYVGLELAPDMSLYKAYGIGPFRDFLSSIFMCIWCMSRWVALVIAVAYLLIPVVTVAICVPFAISTCVIALEKVSEK